MNCPICGRQCCKAILAIGKRGPAFAKVIPTTKLPEWAFANDNARRTN